MTAREYTRAELVAALHDAIVAAIEHPAANMTRPEPDQLWEQVRELMGDAIDPAYLGPGYARFRRQLDYLAASGRLVKIRKGDRTPDGYAATTPRYYTPAGYEAAKAEAARKRAGRAATAEHLTAIEAELTARGIEQRPRLPHEPIRLAPAAWDALLAQRPATLIAELEAREREWREVVAGLAAGGHDVAASQVESCRAELAGIIHAAGGQAS